jgi:diaminopimelate decarboxylase
VGKTVPELAAALDAGIYGFNVESEGELRALSELAARWERPRADRAAREPGHRRADAARLHAHRSRGDQVRHPDRRARDLYGSRRAPRDRGAGVDVHIGSQILEVEPYRRRSSRCSTWSRAPRDEGHELEYLDVGGGLGISYAGEEGISAQAFAAAVVPRGAPTGLTLVVEPGRYIVGEAGILVTRVLYVKEGGGKRFVITDAGMNDLLRPSHYAGYHAVEPVENGTGPAARRRGRADLRDGRLPRARPGDGAPRARRAARRSAPCWGAYGFSMSSTYNQRPAARRGAGGRAEQELGAAARSVCLYGEHHGRAQQNPLVGRLSEEGGAFLDPEAAPKRSRKHERSTLSHPDRFALVHLLSVRPIPLRTF